MKEGLYYLQAVEWMVELARAMGRSEMPLQAVVACRTLLKEESSAQCCWAA